MRALSLSLRSFILLDAGGDVARQHYVFRQVMRRDPPNYLKAFYMRKPTFPDTKKVCDYCEAARLNRIAHGEELPTDKEQTWHLRSTLVKLPNGLFICRRHPGPSVRAFDAVRHLEPAG